MCRKNLEFADSTNPLYFKRFPRIKDGFDGLLSSMSTDGQPFHSTSLPLKGAVDVYI